MKGGNNDKSWNIKFFYQIQAIEYNHLRFNVPKEWRLNAPLQVIEFAVNHCWQKDKDYKKKQEIKEGEEEDVCGSKKKHIEEKFVAEKSLMH